MKLKFIALFLMAASFCYAQELPISKSEIYIEAVELDTRLKLYLRGNDYVDNPSEYYNSTIKEWENEIKDVQQIKENPFYTNKLTFWEKWSVDDVREPIFNATKWLREQYEYPYNSYWTYSLASSRNAPCYYVIRINAHKQFAEEGEESDCKVYVRFTYDVDYVKIDAWTQNANERGKMPDETVDRLVEKLNSELNKKNRY